MVDDKPDNNMMPDSKLASNLHLACKAFSTKGGKQGDATLWRIVTQYMYSNTVPDEKLSYLFSVDYLMFWLPHTYFLTSNQRQYCMFYLTTFFFDNLIYR